MPAQLTSFIGREREIGEVSRRLATTRLLTLVGTGGVGKTRLALQVADGLLEAYSCVWLVELAAVADPSLVAQAVATALGVRERPGRALPDTLVDALRPTHVLLVLDNCEHLIDACAALADTLLRACPCLQILATSRQALGIAGETTWRVPSLSLPEPRRLLEDGRAGGAAEADRVPALTQYEAVRLFVERARAVLPTFSVTDRNGPALAQLCRRLDGIPLALELAAARVEALTVEQIAQRLDERFRLLTGGSRTAVPRHRTLRALMDWSYELLSEPERVLLRRLVVFGGGWTLDAVEGVCGGEGVAPAEVLDLLSQLVNKSLVLAEERDGAVRYRMLESVCEYGDEKLRESGEEAALRGRQRAWFLALAERAGRELWGPAQATWLDRLDTELDNVWAALRWSLTAGGATELGLRVSWSLLRFWEARGHLSEGRGWVTGFLALAPERTTARADALCAAGYLAWLQGDLAGARALVEEGLAIGQDVGYAFGTDLAMLLLGQVVTAQGDHGRAAALLEESLPLARHVEDRTHRYILTVISSFWRGQAAHLRGEQQRAVALFEETLRLTREQGDRWSSAHVIFTLGCLALIRADFERAAALQRESLALWWDMGDLPGIARSLHGLAWAASAEGRAARAARLLGAAEPLRTAIGADLEPMPQWHADRNGAVAVARAELGAEAFAAAWAAGRAMPLDEAVEYALAAEEPRAIRHTESERAAAVGQPNALTPREREVAVLIAKGLSNRQIAEALVIAELTANTHVRNILGKLGFRSRAQVAAWAVEQGLLASRAD